MTTTKPRIACLPGDEPRWCSHCHQMLPHRYRPSPDAGAYWRCSECGEPQEPVDAFRGPAWLEHAVIACARCGGVYGGDGARAGVGELPHEAVRLQAWQEVSLALDTSMGPGDDLLSK